MNLERRMGGIRVQRDLIKDIDVSKALFSNFYPYHTANEDWGVLTYHGFSEHFEIVPEATVPPFYDAEMVRHENGEFSITFKKL